MLQAHQQEGFGFPVPVSKQKTTHGTEGRGDPVTVKDMGQTEAEAVGNYKQ